jgi:hypothetical protein
VDDINCGRRQKSALRSKFLQIGEGYASRKERLHALHEWRRMERGDEGKDDVKQCTGMARCFGEGMEEGEE